MKQLLFILFCIVAFTACKKEYSVEDVKQVPKPTSNPEVVTVGKLFSIGGIRAVYWKDSNFSYVEPSTTLNTDAFSVEKWNNNTIIIGTYASGSWKPCYWVNGQKYILPIPTILNNAECYAHDIKIYNNNIYILGRISDNTNNDYTHFIWKLTDINTPPQIILLKTPSNSADRPNIGLLATNMAVANNKLFVFGSYKAQFTNPARIRKQPCIWELDALNNITVNIPEQNANISFNMNWGDASSQGIYMVGNNNSNNMFIWTKDKRLSTFNKPDFAPYGNGYINGSTSCKINNEGNLYLFYPSLLNNRLQPKLSIINSNGQLLQDTLFSTINNTSGCSFGIDIQNNQYAFGISSYDAQADKSYGLIDIINNNSISLDFKNNDQVYPRYTRIFSK